MTEFHFPINTDSILWMLLGRRDREVRQVSTEFLPGRRVRSWDFLPSGESWGELGSVGNERDVDLRFLFHTA